MNTTLSTIAKDNQTRHKIKLCGEAMKKAHLRKAARYIKRVTDLDVEQILINRGQLQAN